MRLYPHISIIVSSRTDMMHHVLGAIANWAEMDRRRKNNLDAKWKSEDARK